MPEPRTDSQRPRYRRRGRRPRTYSAVLTATTRLLETTPLAELSVAQILEAAGVGRTSFYEHFSSKDDVVVKLLRSVSAEIADEIEPMFTRAESVPPTPPEEALREGLTRLVRMSARYAPLMLTASEEWPAVPALRRLWFRVHAALTERIATVIEQGRAAGIAPDGAEATALAASLVWTTERALQVAKTGQVPALPDHESLIEPLVQLYVGTIYGTTEPIYGRTTDRHAAPAQEPCETGATSRPARRAGSGG